MFNRRAFFAFLLIFLAAIFTRAQSGPDNDPAGLQGFAGGPFATLNPDSINLFNGQLTIPIALGPSYPIGPNLRFQAVLTYNSRVWELGHPSSLHQSTSFAYTPITGNPALGIGWNFSLGAVKLCSAIASTYCYVGPDGGQHIFDEADAARGAGFFKSSDGSRLSLKNNGATGFEMWDEVGNHYLFESAGHVTGFDDALSDFIHDFGRGRDGWYLTKLEDPFHNNFTVSYYTSTPGSNKPCWTYADTPNPNGAIQCPVFQAAQSLWIPSRITVPVGTGGTQDIRVDLDPATSMISQFEFPILGGGMAVWTLGYDNPPNHRYANPSSGTMNLQTISSISLPTGLGGNPSYTFSYLSDPCPSSGLLARIAMPTLATIDYQYRTYNFYHTRIARFGTGCQVTLAPDGQYIAGSELDNCVGYTPIRGGHPYLPIGTCDTSNIDAYLDTITKGVGKRTLTVGGVAAATDYYQYSFPYGEYGTTSTLNCDPIGRCGSRSLTIVVSPEVDLNSGAPGSGRKASRAVLFTVASDGAGGTEGAPIEDRIFDHDASVQEFPAVPYSEPLCGQSAFPEQPFCADKAVRVTQRSFEYGDDVNVSSGNRRLSVETTIYQTTDTNEGCTGCPTHQVAFSNSPGRSWDASNGTGNGRHYNIETHSGTLDNSNRTITTTWLPQISSAVYLPDIFTERRDVFGSSTRDQLFEFDTTTGFPTGTFIWDATTQRVWLNCKYKDGHGNVSQEFTKTFSSGALAYTYCSGNYGSMPSVGQDQDMFGRSYSYQNGEILTSTWLNGTASVGWNQFTLTRDGYTGWITAAADSAGASTDYAHDSIGRTTSVTPPGEAVLNINYPSMTQTTAQRSGGAGLATYDELNYDGLGRLTKQRRFMPGNQYVKRFFQYDGRGTPYFASDWVTDSTPETVTADLTTSCSFPGSSFSTKRPSAAPGSYQLCFDPFGRPQQVVGNTFSSLVTADRTSGSSYYSDVRAAVTVACVNGTLINNGSCVASGTNATTTTTLDAFGRVTSVTEPSGDVAKYAYDVNDNLTCVKQGGTPDMTSCTNNTGGQYRSFVYDPFGFLRQEITPEKGSVSADSIGSLGNLRQATEPGTLITLRCYDAAGRVTSVRSNETNPPVTPACGSPGAGATYLGFTYDQNSNPPSNYSLGKLTQRQGFNPLVGQAPTVTDNFTYGGTGGRVSQQATTVTGVPGSSTTQKWLYNSLGLVAHHYHPRADGAASFVVSTGYDAGLPVTEYINGMPMVTGVSYQPSGALGGYRTGVYLPPATFGQNVLTTIQQDAPKARLLNISTSGASSPFATGNYAYDGAGNVIGMGSDAFTYDTRSRLTQGYLAGVGGSNCQSFSYDAFGNLLTKGSGNWSSGNCSTTATTTFCTGTCTNNQLPSGNALYNARGNLTDNYLFGNEHNDYDSLNRVWQNQLTGTTQYVYDGGSERAAKVQGGTWTYTLRDGSLLATEISGSSPSLDNVFLGSRLVASYAPGNTRVWAFYTTDHLGTPRLITDLNGNTVETRRHWPYGEAVGTLGGLERLRFAGMERDLESNHYYDHARNPDFNLGRFLTPDLLLGAPLAPQSWNRYAYALGNPMRYVDPYGLMEWCSKDEYGEPEPCTSDSITVTATFLPPDPWSFPFGGGGPPLPGLGGGGGWGGNFGPGGGDRGAGSRAIGQQGNKQGACTGQGGVDDLTPLERIAEPLGGLPLEAVANLSAGFGDTITFGLTSLTRPYNVVDTSSVAYFGGVAAGTAWWSLATREGVQPGGWLNSNRYLRIGFGRRGGDRVFRAAGQLIKTLFGKDHIDLRNCGPL